LIYIHKEPSAHVVGRGGIYPASERMFTPAKPALCVATFGTRVILKSETFSRSL